MGRVVHFEIHASEPEAVAAFYRTVFGWRITKMPDMEYWLVETGDANAPGINGGLLRRRGPKPLADQPVNAQVCTVQVSKIDEHLDRATRAGGSIALPKMVIPGVGWVAYAKDPDGSLFGLHEPDPTAQ